MNLGLAIIAITALGGISNWINWRFLGYRVTEWLYYIGAFVHETSHAVLCVATGAPIVEYKILSPQPHVTHAKSKLPIVGEALISLAPIAGGLLFLFLVNRYLLSDYFSLPILAGWRDTVTGAAALLGQINIFHWQSWVMVFLAFNLGAMIGPSPQDLKNMWPLLILLLFVPFSLSSPLGGVLLFAATLILLNILLQVVLIIFIKIAGLFIRVAS